MSDSQILLYQTDDKKTQIEVRLENDTVWLNQKLMAELFQTTVPNINIHIKNIFDEGELIAVSTIKDYLIVQSEANRKVSRSVSHYNLDVIISVGYRVKSHIGTQFRIWATQKLKEYLIKGFVLNDQKFKDQGGGDHFDELLARIRDIRSSEKVFWRKVLDIYATSEDYDKDNDLSHQFFRVVQNKMHWAAHGHTAAEIIHARADASKPDMGLTSRTGSRICKADTDVAKNYLTAEEIDALNRIVSFYLDFAELQAMGKRQMRMADWIKKLDDFLRLSERDILTHAGKISHDKAVAKAHAEYEKFRILEANKPSPVERDFDEAIRKAKQIESSPHEPNKPKAARKR
jgi:hypothetical protein